MRKSKLIITVLLTAALAGSLVACGGKDSTEKAETEAGTEAAAEAEAETETKTEAAAETGEGSLGAGASDTEAADTTGADSGEAAEFPGIEMTDTYTFTDPEDLDFDTRYVFKGDSTCKILVDMLNFDFRGVAMYEILYEKDGEAVGEYQYFVMEDEENAKGLADFYAGQGQTVTQEENRVYAFSNGDLLKSTIMTFKGVNMISDEKPETYARYIADTNGLVEQ